MMSEYVGTIIVTDEVLNRSTAQVWAALNDLGEVISVAYRYVTDPRVGRYAIPTRLECVSTEEEQLWQFAEDKTAQREFSFSEEEIILIDEDDH